ncbi:sugar phosphate isomerase/epimerase [Kocuria salina]|uniref:sugar phosphate isomerase/epimerase family protein n=1 Tax=Kocuria salina TaxID=1929416 RepID=UPI00159312D5|nr:sugar phosphate isomerase/epimerase [Kocuria salina]NVC25003.1 sugar phosphate isomerase/epimerase [Kocuria salina]
MFSSRLGCSSISFRHQPLPTALGAIDALGFAEIDLGALPGVCDHVPYVLDAVAVEQVAADVQNSGLRVRSVNGDVGDLNAGLDERRRADRAEHLEMLLELTAAVGAEALVLPCGALDHEPVRSLEEDIRTVAGELACASRRAAAAGVELWCESLHFFRLCWNEDRARRLADELEGTGVGMVMDFSHIVASGGDPVRFVETFAERITHVHLRDATAGNIHLSIGNGEADFAAGLKALERIGYTGHFSLELETRDVTHEQRPAATRLAAEYISSLL